MDQTLKSVQDIFMCLHAIITNLEISMGHRKLTTITVYCSFHVSNPGYYIQKHAISSYTEL